VRWNGGGGIGDPLSRPAESVLKDVTDGVVSSYAAEQLYGVIIRNNQIDLSATQQRRATIRSGRLTLGAAS
jgi:N-methylhydantoinase B